MPQNFPTNRQNPNRKDESIRRANRVIQTRTFVLMLIMGIGMFFLLFFKLYNLQITRHEELQAKAVSQQTRSSVVTGQPRRHLRRIRQYSGHLLHGGDHFPLAQGD